MPAAAPPLPEPAAQHLAQLGEQLRQARKRQQVTAAAAAEAAGMSRVTLHRIEKGETSVTVGAWLAAAQALGLELSLADPAQPAAQPLPDRIRLADYPQLKQLAWQLPGVEELTPQEALSLYERNWRHVDGQSLTMKEIALVNALATTIGGGRPLV
ncbi:helix-turn-helix domain-containing protein [Ramlibacter humi]|uniref:XRE family transcriptional regulator n=1 Tax=Ramlibacter humi TaxID=2530451 RepID=A0A4Z0CCJ2_9BURK|nr:helix-turn-helix domain-containing protein [Ramlibacter humi]TFZ08784.1 XRE family transcriptional regulator [Ramlibacter humi]